MPRTPDVVLPAAGTAGDKAYRGNGDRCDDAADTDDDEGDVSFASLLLSPGVTAGLADAGFRRPSPVQKAALPLVRLGVDLLVQAKSGTGKTCVFLVAALESVHACLPAVPARPQALVLVPTREVAVQVSQVARLLGGRFPRLGIGCFIGGVEAAVDTASLRNCHIAVATPGRCLALLRAGVMSSLGVRLLVLDEADKLFDTSFQQQVLSIWRLLPARKQVIAVSATFPPALQDQVTGLMRTPQRVMLAPDEPSLLGVTQYRWILPADTPMRDVWPSKMQRVMQVLASLSFQQAILFCNDAMRGEQVTQRLCDAGWPAAFISGLQPQAVRTATMQRLRDFQLRVLVSTDLTARGIDVERINLILNLDMPYDASTYLHRVGRTGRFGSYGVAINMVTEAEAAVLDRFAVRYACRILPLPQQVPEHLYRPGQVEALAEGKEGKD